VKRARSTTESTDVGAKRRSVERDTMKKLAILIALFVAIGQKRSFVVGAAD